MSSHLDAPSAAVDRLVVSFHDSQPADDPVAVREDGTRVLVTLSPDADRDALEHELSYGLTVYLRSSWLYIGSTDGEA